jgi:antitoxin component YwqK of YwqJK toxin-antitoxin module
MKLLSIFLVTLLTTFAMAKTVKTFYPDGSKKSETSYKEGKKNGIEHIFYPDGATLKYSKSYIYGKLHGLQQSYSQDAMLVREISYNHGRLDGRSRYYHKGLLTKEIDYRNGLLDGSYKEFFPSGLIKLEIFWRNGRAIEGYSYSEEGKRTPINAKVLKELQSDKIADESSVQ